MKPEIRMRKWIAAKEIAKKEIANDIGVSAANLSHILAGRQKIQSYQIYLLAKKKPELVAFMFSILPHDAEEALNMSYLIEEEERLESMSELEKLTEIYAMHAYTLPESAREDIRKRIEVLKNE